MAYKPKIVLLDIENSPAKGFFFGKVYETNILSVTDQSYILCYSYSLWPDKKVYTVALPDFKGYKDGSDCEELMLARLWELLDQSDIIVGQNIDSFDLRHINSRFAFYGMTPPSPYKTVDTLKKLRSVFNLPSNKLDYVCGYFNMGGKLPNTGRDLWLACMNGDLDAWKDMKRYNAHDIKLTHKLYEKLLPWGKQPNLNLLTDRIACSACGSKNTQKRGSYKMLGGRIMLRIWCADCGKWNKMSDEKQAPITVRPL